MVLAAFGMLLYKFGTSSFCKSREFTICDAPHDDALSKKRNFPWKTKALNNLWSQGHPQPQRKNKHYHVFRAMWSKLIVTQEALFIRSKLWLSSHRFSPAYIISRLLGYLKKHQTFITLIKLLAGISDLKFGLRSRAGRVVERKLSNEGDNTAIYCCINFISHAVDSCNKSTFL